MFRLTGYEVIENSFKKCKPDVFLEVKEINLNVINGKVQELMQIFVFIRMTWCLNIPNARVLP